MIIVLMDQTYPHTFLLIAFRLEVTNAHLIVICELKLLRFDGMLERRNLRIQHALIKSFRKLLILSNLLFLLFILI